MILFLLLFVCFLLLLLLLVMAFILLILPKRQKKIFFVCVCVCLCVSASSGTPALAIFYILDVFVYICSHIRRKWLLLRIIYSFEICFISFGFPWSPFSARRVCMEVWLKFLRLSSVYFWCFFLFYLFFFFFARFILYFSWIVSIFAVVVVVVPFWIILSVYCFAGCFFK